MEISFPCRPIRQTLAINLFKQLVLDSEHIPNDPQTESILEIFTISGMEECLDHRTWSGWFGNSPRRARRDAFEVLDRFFEKGQGHDLHAQESRTRSKLDFFVKLLDEGLVGTLLAPTTSKHPVNTLIQRATEYQPASALHLHLDALEAAAVAEPNGDVPWETVKEIAARRVLDLLHARWGPRHGTVYSSFSSSLKIAWEKAGEQERKHIRKRYTRCKPDMFEQAMHSHPVPAWSSIGIQGDNASTQIHKLLLAFLADHPFLVGDRFDAWLLDLISAALGMHALAWTDRYVTYGPRVQPELIYWRAFDFLFYGHEPTDQILDAVECALGFTGLQWSTQYGELLLKARHEYRQLFATLGVDINNLSAMANRCWKVRPLVYGG